MIEVARLCSVSQIVIEPVSGCEYVLRMRVSCTHGDHLVDGAVVTTDAVPLHFGKEIRNEPETRRLGQTDRLEQQIEGNDVWNNATLLCEMQVVRMLQNHGTAGTMIVIQSLQETIENANVCDGAKRYPVSKDRLKQSGITVVLTFSERCYHHLHCDIIDSANCTDDKQQRQQASHLQDFKF